MARYLPGPSHASHAGCPKLENTQGEQRYDGDCKTFLILKHRLLILSLWQAIFPGVQIGIRGYR